MLTSGGHPDPPIWQRVFWASAEGATAGILLYAGGEKVLTALQAGVVSIALPFCALIVLLCVSLQKGLQTDPLFAKGGAELLPPASDEPDQGEAPAPMEEPRGDDVGAEPEPAGE